MWRAYTREKPARQGLALIIVALSSGLVAGFAGAVVDYKATPILASDDRAPSSWPVTFKLPPDFDETTAIRAAQLDNGLKAMDRKIIFRSRTDARRRIGIGQRKSSTSNEMVDFMVSVVERTALDPAEKIEPMQLPVADAEWRFLKKTRADSVTYFAMLQMPDGSGVRIAFATPSASAKDRRALAAMCNSVAKREGFTEPDDSD